MAMLTRCGNSRLGLGVSRLERQGNADMARRGVMVKAEQGGAAIGGAMRTRWGGARNGRTWHVIVWADEA